MIRFKCIHCGGRIAVPDDHTDRLARCPDCGGVTHPLAEHLSANKTADSSKKAAGNPPEAPACANCGGPLGKLQKPFEWDGELVCGPCHRMLTLDKTPPTEVVTPIPVTSTVDSLAVREPSVSIPLGYQVRRKALPTEFTLYVRTAVIGLVVVAAALWLIVSILQSLGYLFMWGAGVAVVVAAIYWVRRGIVAIRRRAGLRKTLDV